jgi:DNA-binding transcriptional LysR family regulator
VQAELRLSDSFSNLVEEGIDVAVRIGELADSSLVARRVGETGQVLVASPDYVARRGAPRRPEDLAGHDCIAFSSLFAPSEWRFFGNGAWIAISVAPRFATNSSDAAIGEAIRGGGLAFVLAYQAADAIRRGELVQVLADFAPPPRPIQLVFPSSRLLAVNVRAFIDQVTAEARWKDWV